MENLLHNSENSICVQTSEQKNKRQYSSIKRQELFFWMANTSEKILCEIMKAINPAPYKKIMGPDLARLHALLVAADEVRSALKLTGRKNSEHDLNRLEE
ncbi:MAG: hypothetical protein LIP28_07095 [Deltaproteobacteria bacterium]|nr:hypothetical protein [Deltaproteobacteria bacterium]